MSSSSNRSSSEREELHQAAPFPQDMSKVQEHTGSLSTDTSTVAGGVLDTLVTPASTATLAAEELACLPLPHSTALQHTTSFSHASGPGLKATSSQRSHSLRKAGASDEVKMQRSQGGHGVATEAAQHQAAHADHHKHPAAVQPAKGSSVYVDDSIPSADGVAAPVPSPPGSGPQDVSGSGHRIATSTEVGRLSSQASSTGSLLRAGSSSGRKSSAVPDFPMSSAKALLFMASALTDYEQGEILNYKVVYFLGKPGTAKIKGSVRSPHNHGYDDENGEYRVVIGDHIAFRYEVLSKLGAGSFGQVLKCRDHKTGADVALKLVRNKKRFHKQAQVEVDLLVKIRDADAPDRSRIIHVQDTFSFRQHLAISFPIMAVNLYEATKLNKFQGFPLALIRKIAVQLLAALRFLRRLQVVHCDLKPENILLERPGHSAVRVIDLGSGCYQDKRVYTYIQSRFYRAPEVILGRAYGHPIDMWSFACILSELYTGWPLFPGTNEHEQLLCIMEVFGPPPAAVREGAKRAAKFFDEDGEPIVVPFKGRVRIPGTRTLQRAIDRKRVCDDTAFVDFLAACLHWEPSKRLTPEEALDHPWMADSPPALMQAARSAQPMTATEWARAQLPPMEQVQSEPRCAQSSAPEEAAGGSPAPALDSVRAIVEAAHEEETQGKPESPQPPAASGAGALSHAASHVHLPTVPTLPPAKVQTVAGDAAQGGSSRPGQGPGRTLGVSASTSVLPSGHSLTGRSAGGPGLRAVEEGGAKARGGAVGAAQAAAGSSLPLSHPAATADRTQHREGATASEHGISPAEVLASPPCVSEVSPDDVSPMPLQPPRSATGSSSDSSVREDTAAHVPDVEPEDVAPAPSPPAKEVQEDSKATSKSARPAASSSSDDQEPARQHTGSWHTPAQPIGGGGVGQATRLRPLAAAGHTLVRSTPALGGAAVSSASLASPEPAKRAGAVPALNLGALQAQQAGQGAHMPMYTSTPAHLSAVAAHRRRRAQPMRAASLGRMPVGPAASGLASLSAVGSHIQEGGEGAAVYGTMGRRRPTALQHGLAPMAAGSSPSHAALSTSPSAHGLPASAAVTPVSTARRRPDRPTPRAAVLGRSGPTGHSSFNHAPSTAVSPARGHLRSLHRGGVSTGRAQGGSLTYSTSPSSGSRAAVTARTRGRSRGRLASLDASRTTSKEGTGLSTSAIAAAAMGGQGSAVAVGNVRRVRSLGRQRRKARR